MSQINKNKAIDLHISGATVQHKNPFEQMEVPRNKKELSKEFLEKWVIPFYLNKFSDLDELIIQKFADAATEINADKVLTLLSEFNWRNRITGAYFAAINKYQEFENIIGKHLLMSKVSYAGSGYCLALATFATENSKNYLKSYLDYYLTRTDLWFDQAHAYCALEFLDKDMAISFSAKWNHFIADKPTWSLDKSRQHFVASMSAVENIRQMKYKN